MTRHTEAPWTVHPKRYPSGNFAIMAKAPNSGAKIDIAAVYHPEWGYDSPRDQAEAHANARLICAAPELLEALHKINDRIYARGAPLGTEDYFEIRKICTTAIDKAKGA
jgi:hypothetical protein